jgi:nucleotide-binding universal stress UspA family protein
MRKVLVAIDGSDAAFRALDYAASMAKSGSPLAIHLLYVYPDISYADRSHAYRSNEELERPERQHGESVLKAAAERASPSGAEITQELVSGYAAQIIVKRAETLGCDSIVMGMKGQGLIAELLLGSTTMSVVHSAKLPVTLVK